MTTYKNILETGDNPLDVWPEATMTVTYNDGKVESFERVRVLGMTGYRDPVLVRGTMLSFEQAPNAAPVYLLGVRRFSFEITRDGDGEV